MMEPDQRAAFRRSLRKDAAAVLPQPHEPTDECWGIHCSWHNLDEAPDGAYRVCAECGHVYRTAEDLRRAWADAAVDASVRQALDVIAPPVEQICGCPYCAHDW